MLICFIRKTGNDQIGSVCKVMTESLEDEVPAEETEGTIINNSNIDSSVEDADINDNENINEIEE